VNRGVDDDAAARFAHDYLVALQAHPYAVADSMNDAKPLCAERLPPCRRIWGVVAAHF
jgi:hypothetical protein